jgi:hypothetical protein
MLADLTIIGSNPRLEDTLIRPILPPDGLRRRHNRSGTSQSG